MVERASRQLVEQRLRNRQIEYFEMASREVELLDYEASVPVNIFAELLNQWDDYLPYPRRIPKKSWFSRVVYSEEEIEEILRFHAVWEDVSKSTPNGIDRIPDFLEMPEWQQLKSAAQSALTVFSKRGRLSEDDEVVA